MQIVEVVRPKEAKLTVKEQIELLAKQAVRDGELPRDTPLIPNKLPPKVERTKRRVAIKRKVGKPRKTIRARGRK